MTKDWVHGVGHSPVCQILLQTVVRAVITSSPPAWTSSAGMLSTPADFLYFSDCTAASTSLQRMGWSSSVSVWVQFSTDGSPPALWLYSSEQYSVHLAQTASSKMLTLTFSRRIAHYGIAEKKFPFTLHQQLVDGMHCIIPGRVAHRCVALARRSTA